MRAHHDATMNTKVTNYALSKTYFVRSVCIVIS